MNCNSLPASHVTDLQQKLAHMIPSKVHEAKMDSSMDGLGDVIVSYFDRRGSVDHIKMQDVRRRTPESPLPDDLR